MRSLNEVMEAYSRENRTRGRQGDVKDEEREEDIEVSVEAEFILMEEEVLPSLFLLDFIFYSKQYIYTLSSLNQTVITEI